MCGSWWTLSLPMHTQICCQDLLFLGQSMQRIGAELICSNVLRCRSASYLLCRHSPTLWNNNKKNKIKNKTLSYFKETITRSGNYKTKVEHLLEVREDWKPGQRPTYMSNRTRNQTSIIFQGRARMLKVKNNYKKDKMTYYVEYARHQKKHSSTSLRNVGVFIQMIQQK